ncbi:transposase [Microcoleus sp. FACHB-61]|uniref:transposase n=1 Tax=Microcoleus vaginatus TaxID=119532 RepID=UPI001681E682|nr:transposase [Microcoleus sp. FACHB-61]
MVKERYFFCSDAVQNITSYLQRICNYFINRASSGVMERINTPIKFIMRQGYAFLTLTIFEFAYFLAFLINKSYKIKYNRTTHRNIQRLLQCTVSRKLFHRHFTSLNIGQK